MLRVRPEAGRVGDGQADHEQPATITRPPPGGQAIQARSGLRGTVTRRPRRRAEREVHDALVDVVARELAATPPSRQTSTRWASRTTSGRSLEANTTAIPSAASARMSP